MTRITDAIATLERVEQHVPAIGTRAQVIIDGTVEVVNLDKNRGVGVMTAGRYGAWVSGDDPDVRLVLDPEVRALPDRETTARALLSARGYSTDEVRVIEGSRYGLWTTVLAEADAVLALFGQEGQR